MRDTERIAPLLGDLHILWRRYPDLRLGQLVAALTPRNLDPFYVEDDAIHDRVKEVLENGFVPSRDG